MAPDEQSKTDPTAPAVPATVAFSVTDLITVLNRYGVDLRSFLLLLPAGGVFYIDEALAKTTFTAMLFMCVFALLSHVLRKVYFPYVDTEKFSNAALGNPIGAGLVFLGICMVISSVVIASVLWMGH